MSNVFEMHVKETPEGEILSVSVIESGEFVPIGSPEHRQMVADTLERHEYERQAMKPLRILPVETHESELVGRTERARTLRFLAWAFGLFWLAVELAFIWRKL